MSMHSSTAAEKGDEGMALKIRTRAEDIPDGYGNRNFPSLFGCSKLLKANK